MSCVISAFIYKHDSIKNVLSKSFVPLNNTGWFKHSNQRMRNH